jgi:hypothetical protein
MKAQEAPVPRLSPGSARKTPPSLPASTIPSPQLIVLSVPKGTPLQVALDQEIRVANPGQPVHARIMEPVYAFDRLVIPVGSKVDGQITKIGKISATNRTLAALDADFTPARKVEVSFSDLELPDGKHLQLQTNVTAGSGQIIRLVAAADGQKRAGIKGAAKNRDRKERERLRPSTLRHPAEEASTSGVRRSSLYYSDNLLRNGISIGSLTSLGLMDTDGRPFAEG